jgi:hypothetical protein
LNPLNISNIVMNKQKISRITILALLTLLFASAFLPFNISLAQTPADTQSITPQMLKNAQKDVAACQTFKDQIWNASSHQFKAVWGIIAIRNPIGTGWTKIIDRGGIYGDASMQPSSTADMLQKVLESGTTLTAKQFTAAATQYNLDQQEGGVVGKVVGTVLNSILTVVAAVVAVFTAIAGEIFSIAVKWVTNVQTLPAIVDVGWTVVRDIANMFFILILIVISLATILRIEEYDYKKLLRDVVIMALLVNFSKEIALVLMNFVGMIVRLFANDLGLDSIGTFYYSFIRGGVVPFGGWMGGLADGIGRLVYALVALFTFVALSVMFVIRLVGLYVLIIISPMAYVLNILPSTKNYAQEWWKHFIKYLIWAPVALFFVKLAVLLTQNGGLGGNNDPNGTAFRFFIVAGFMLAAVMVAKQAGMVGGEQVADWAKKGTFGAAKFFGGGALGLAGRTYSKWANNKLEQAKESGNTGAAKFWQVAQYANFHVAKEAWEKRSEEKQEEAYMPAIGNAWDTLNRVMPTEWHKKEGKWELGQRTHYGRIAQQELINKKIKQWTDANLSEEEKNKAIQQAHHPEDSEALETVHIKGRHEDGDEISMGMEERKKREKEIYNELRKNGESDEAAKIMAATQAKEEVAAEFDAVDHLDTVTERLKEGGLTKDQTAVRVAHMDEVGEAENKIRTLGGSVYEEHEGRFRTANDLEGYQVLEKDLGSASMLDALDKLHVGVAEKADVNDKNGVKVGEKIVAIRFKDGKGGEIKVQTYDQLQAAIEATTGKDKKEKAAFRVAGGDIRYNIIGSRKNQSAEKRMKRGDAERWAKAHEPAAYLVQNEDGKFIRFTSFGAQRFSSIDGNSVNAFRKTRGVQARVSKLAGIYQDKDGKYDINNFDMHVMAEALKLNPDFAKAIIQKAELEEDVRGEVSAKLASLGVTLSAKDMEPATR